MQLKIEHLVPYIPYCLRIEVDGTKQLLSCNILSEWFEWGVNDFDISDNQTEVRNFYQISSIAPTKYGHTSVYSYGEEFITPIDCETMQTLIRPANVTFISYS